MIELFLQGVVLGLVGGFVAGVAVFSRVAMRRY